MSFDQIAWIAIPAVSLALYGLSFYLQRRELGSVARWFSAFLAAAALWSFGSMVLHSNPDFIDPAWAARVLILGIAAVPLTVYGLTVHFLALPRRQMWSLAVGLFFLFIVILDLVGVVVVDSEISQGLVTTTYGWGLIAVFAIWLLCFSSSIYLLIRDFQRSKDPIFRERIKYLLITFVLLWAAGMVDATPLAAYPEDQLLVGLTAVLISLSISPHQFVEVRQAVRRVAILILIAALYIAAVSGALSILSSLNPKLLMPAGFVAAAATIALLLIYQPVRAGLASFIDHVLFPDQSSANRQLFTINAIGGQLRLPPELGTDILNELVRAFKCECASLFLKDDLEAAYRRIASVDAGAGGRLPDGGPATVFRADSPLIQALQAHRLAMHIDRLQELPSARALGSDEWRALRALKAAALVPVLAGNDVLALIVLGARAGNEPYTRHELQHTLPLLANQISIALANSRLYTREQARADMLARANAELRQAQEALRDSSERVRHEAARTKALARIADRLNAQLDLDTVLTAVCEETASAIGVSAVCVSLYHERSDDLRPVTSFGLPADFRERSRPLPRAAYEARMQQERVVSVSPQPNTRLPNADVYAALGVRTSIATRMTREGQLVGSLDAFTFDRDRSCSDDELALLDGIAAQAAQAIINARLYADAQRRLDNVQALREIDATITGSIDLQITLNVLLSHVRTQLKVDAADILLLNAPANMLEYAAGIGFRSSVMQHLRVRLGEDHAGTAVLERRLSFVPDLSSSFPYLRSRLLSRDEFVSYVGVPLIAKNQVKGVLEILHRSALEPDDEWLSFLEALATRAAIALDNSELFASLQRSNLELRLAYESTLEGWARALELRDLETEGHTRRVTEMTERLARSIGIDEEDIVHVRRGALLHDIGKMAIPDSILLKPGPLTDEEREIMRQHPSYAYQLLASIPFLRRALVIPYAHHEWWDGSGYPRGLKGEDIPLWARIFAVVDVWDALRSRRAYHEAWPDDEVAAYLHEQAGRQFDPQVVKVFLSIPRTDWPAYADAPDVR